jgi:hypothetical protein
MGIAVRNCSQYVKHFGPGALLLLGAVAIGFCQKLPQPTRVWSVGPLTKSEPVMGVAFGPGGVRFTGPHVDSQTGSVFSATRSVVFAGDRIVLASRVGTRRLEGARVPEEVYQLLSLDAQTGEVKDTRGIEAFGSVPVFATNDAHVILAGRSVMRLTPDLKDAGTFDYHARGHKFGSVENISLDGSTLGNATSPGFELVDARSLEATELTVSPSVATSVSKKGFLTDNVQWIRDYPKDLSFVTYTDAAGEHLIYHGKCGGRPQFLSDDLVFEPGCKNPLIIDIHGNVIRTLRLKGEFSYAGVSQNGKRLALQIASFSGMHSLKHEHFVVYSVDTGEPVAEVVPDELAEGQSWTAFSPDGSMIVVGSPLKLTLYRLP